MGVRISEQAAVGLVIFQRAGAVLHMLDVSDPPDGTATHLLATIPIRHETGSTLDVDLNEGFDRVYSEEDRTGEDYYGRIDRHDQTDIQALRSEGRIRVVP